jgi:hypothetical protein
VRSQKAPARSLNICGGDRNNFVAEKASKAPARSRSLRQIFGVLHNARTE